MKGVKQSKGSIRSLEGEDRTSAVARGTGETGSPEGAHYAANVFTGRKRENIPAGFCTARSLHSSPPLLFPLKNRPWDSPLVRVLMPALLMAWQSN